MEHRWLMLILCVMIATCMIGCDSQGEITPTVESTPLTPTHQEPAQEVTLEPIHESPSEPVQETESNPEPNEVELYGVGEPASQNDITITLTEVDENTGNSVYTPENGNVFLICHFDIQNDSDKDLFLSEALSFDTYVDDYMANRFTRASMFSSDGGLYRTLDAGRKLKGVVGYEVPEDWSVLEIIFQPYIDIDGKVVAGDEGPVFHVEK